METARLQRSRLTGSMRLAIARAAVGRRSCIPLAVRVLGLVAVVLGGCATTQRIDRPDDTPKHAIAGAQAWHFDGARPGTVPKGWSIRETNATEFLATWQVVEDTTAPSKRNVMALTASRNFNGTYNLAIADNTTYQDVDLTVKVKAVSGKEDQGGGPIWRCRDENNYYICRFNPLEGNYRVYVVLNGKRKQLESTDVDVQVGRWYTLRVTMVGDRVTCYLDGREMLQANDSHFASSGMVGLWTKADAVTSFDDLEVKPLVEGE